MRGKGILFTMATEQNLPHKIIKLLCKRFLSLHIKLFFHTAILDPKPWDKYFKPWDKYPKAWDEYPKAWDEYPKAWDIIL